MLFISWHKIYINDTELLYYKMKLSITTIHCWLNSCIHCPNQQKEFSILNSKGIFSNVITYALCNNWCWAVIVKMLILSVGLPIKDFYSTILVGISVVRCKGLLRQGDMKIGTIRNK